MFFEVANNMGMRAAEILGRTLEEVDFERAEIRLPYARTKEAKDKVIPVNSATLALLKQVAAERSDGRFFDRASTYGQIGHLWREVCKKAKVTISTSTTSDTPSPLGY